MNQFQIDTDNAIKVVRGSEYYRNGAVEDKIEFLDNLIELLQEDAAVLEDSMDADEGRW